MGFRLFPFMVLMFLFLTPSTSVVAQEDSLELKLLEPLEDAERMEILFDLVWDYHKTKPAKAEGFLRDAEELLKEPPDSINYIVIQYYHGLINKNNGNFADAIPYFRSYIQFYENQKDSLKVAAGFYQLGSVFKRLGDYDASLDNYISALNLYRILGKTKRTASTLNALGGVFRGIKRHDDAIRTYEEALRLQKEVGNQVGIANVHNNLALIYIDKKEYDSSLKHFKEQERICKEQNDEGGLGYLYENIGAMYRDQGKLESAESYFRKSIAIRKKLDDTRNLAHTRINLGRVLASLGNSEEGNELITQGLTKAEELGMWRIVQTGRLAMSELKEKEGDFEGALVFHRSYLSIKDSILNMDVANRVTELDAKYGKEEDTRQIVFLTSENELKESRLREASTRNKLFAAGLIIALLLAGFTYFLFRQRKRNNEVLKEKNDVISKALDEKNLLLREIHHRVKNNLQVISSLLSLQSRYIKDENAIKAIEEGRTRVRSMALIHQSLYQKENLVGIDIKSYFEKLLSELFRTYKVDGGKIELEMDIAPLNLDVDTMIPLGLIMNELVSNALKHAFKDRESGLLSLTVKEEDDKLVLQVKDNGIGLENPDIFEGNSSFGNKLISSFSKKLNAELKVESKEGTQVEMRIKNYKIAG